MKFLLKISLLLLISTPVLASTACYGKIPNPITDICWKCLFPIKIGGIEINKEISKKIGGIEIAKGEKGTPEKAPAVCVCPQPPPIFIKVGIGTSYWEPFRVAEVTRTPFCSPLLGGLKISSGSISSNFTSGTQKRQAGTTELAYYNVHWFVYPVLNWMKLMNDTACATPTDTFNLSILSELEPTWNSDELSFIFAPEAALFTNPTTQAACAADCIASTATFPLNALFWCAGCQPSLYPLSGNSVGHTYGLQAGLLVTQRMHTKLHRAGVALDAGGEESMCLLLPKPIIPKSHYKTQLIYPIPNPQSSHFYGESMITWESGKEFPIKGEDFAFLIWRKRLCCAF